MLWLNFVLFSLIFLFLCFWVWQNDNDLKTKGNKILTKNKIDPSTVFSTFDMDKLEKIRRHHWKERLKINKIAKFESDTSLASEDIALQSREILQTFLWWGAQTCNPPHKILQNFVTLRWCISISFRQITVHSNVAILTNFKMLS